MMSDTPPSDPHPTSTLAEAPFRDADADIVLRSCDRVDFHVHKFILSKSSPIFIDMLAMPQPPDAGGSPELSVVNMTEDSRALKILLGFMYAHAYFPSFGHFDDIKIALDLIRKYEMPGPMDMLKRCLMNVAPTAPERVFALAWRYEWKDIVLAAAKHADGRLPLGPSDFAEFRNVSGEAFWKLQDYQNRRKAVVAQLALNWKAWLNPSRLGRPVAGKPNRCYCVQYRRGTRSKDWAHALTVPYWWVEHMSRLYNALAKDPRSEIITSAAILGPTLKDAGKCEVCRDGVEGALDGFNGLFLTHLTYKMSQVELETPF
ncbi:hypothetical protein DENSPDRAFT_835919 [Dentipellis sp. KUC8613]|nr:hypothetical protein DENSPDRAFT_835919 [Dentipellis sp. KUC8613]